MTVLRADAVGLSIEGEGGAPSLIAWSEIHALVGSKVDCIEHEQLVIELEHESGTVFSMTRMLRADPEELLHADDLARELRAEDPTGFGGDAWSEWWRKAFHLRPRQ